MEYPNIWSHWLPSYVTWQYRPAVVARLAQILRRACSLFFDHEHPNQGCVASFSKKTLDHDTPIFQPVKTDISPFVLVTVFHVAAEDLPTRLKLWEANANRMKQPPVWTSARALT